MRGKWFAKRLKAEYSKKNKCIEHISTRERVIDQTKVSKEKSIVVVNVMENTSLENMYNTVTKNLVNNDQSLSESESDDE